jgi:signal-transduction protein with cAMP-binding, CBS, and nucleotidyltransferase domain
MARKVPCLEYLASSELEMLSRSMGVKKLKPGEVIYRPGEVGDRLYVVHKGTVVEASRYPKDGRVEEQILVAGSFFGEEALLAADPRSKMTLIGEAVPPMGTYQSDPFGVDVVDNKAKALESHVPSFELLLNT